MSDSITIEDGFITKDHIWSVCFSDIEFITWKQNYDDKSYFVKLHIGSKETRLQLESFEEVEEVLQTWQEQKIKRNKNE